MTKDPIQTKIKKLQLEDEELIVRRDEIKAKYSRPTEWMADENYKAVARARKAIANEIEDLDHLLKEIEDQEWADRQAKNYPDGQV
jgi:hypothetical protein